MNEKTTTTRPRRQAYPTDLTDAQWAFLKPLFAVMRTYKWSKQELPHDFPPCFTVHSFYSVST